LRSGNAGEISISLISVNPTTQRISPLAAYSALKGDSVATDCSKPSWRVRSFIAARAIGYAGARVSAMGKKKPGPMIAKDEIVENASMMSIFRMTGPQYNGISYCDEIRPQRQALRADSQDSALRLAALLGTRKVLIRLEIERHGPLFDTERSRQNRADIRRQEDRHAIWTIQRF